MIVDAFLYAGEVDMAELRIRTLLDHVDLFVPVCCSLTHQSQRAHPEVQIGELSSRIVRAGLPHDRIRPYTVGAHRYPAGERGGANTRYYQRIEREHRAGILPAVRAAAPGADPWTTLVLVSDVDEIPDPRYLDEELDALFDEGTRWAVCLQRFHSTYLDWLHPAPWWQGTTISRLADLDPQAMRDARTEEGALYRLGWPDLDDWAGWHLSWLGTDAERQEKLETFSHAELGRRGYDPARARRLGEHSNGEPLRCMTAAEILDARWPGPIRTVPDGWWSRSPVWLDD